MNYERKINIIGDIDHDMYSNFVEALDGLEEILEGEDITVELSSHGGDALVALAFYDRIRSSKSNITIRASGVVASAAVIILAAGDTRIMSKNAWAMVHEDTVMVDEDARVTQFERASKTARLLEEQWNSILASRTKTSADVWSDLHKREAYLDAKDCLKFGLVDKVE